MQKATESGISISALNIGMLKNAFNSFDATIFPSIFLACVNYYLFAHYGKKYLQLQAFGMPWCYSISRKRTVVLVALVRFRRSRISGSAVLKRLPGKVT